MVGGRNGKDGRTRQLPWLAQSKSENLRTDKHRGSAQAESTTRNKVAWRKRTRQEEGRKTEKVIAKKRGAKVHPASGALRIKNDASDKEVLYEIKDANKTYTLKGSELLSLWKNAIVQMKEPVFVVYFTDSDITATMTITKGKQ